MHRRKHQLFSYEVALAALLASSQLGAYADQTIKQPQSQPVANQVPTKGVKQKMAIAIFGAG